MCVCMFVIQAATVLLVPSCFVDSQVQAAAVTLLVPSCVVDSQVPKGEEWRNRPRPCCTVRVYNMDFFRKIVLRHDTGLGEAYMDKVGGKNEGEGRVLESR